MKSHRAFTAIELLVVIVLIGMLFVMLMSYPGSGREKARRTQCLNNLKQIGLAGEQYAQDFGDRLPCGKNSVFANLTLMSNYVGSVKVLVCPSSAKKAATGFSDPRASDAANVSYTQHAAPFTPILWKSDTNTVLFWDQGVAGNPCDPTGGSGLSWTNTSNHKGAGGNILFNDGHVAWHKKTPTNMPLGCLNP